MGYFFLFFIFLVLPNFKMIITKFTSGLNVTKPILLPVLHKPPIYIQKTFCAISCICEVCSAINFLMRTYQFCTSH